MDRDKPLSLGCHVCGKPINLDGEFALSSMTPSLSTKVYPAHVGECLAQIEEDNYTAVVNAPLLPKETRP